VSEPTQKTRKRWKFWLMMSLIALFAVWLILTVILLIVPHYTTCDGISVLGYHGVVSDQSKRTTYADDPYTLSASEFENQMKYLSDNGYTTYSMEEIERYLQGELDIPEKAVALTFDDGFLNFNEVVKPILEKYQLKGTCFVIGKHVIDSNRRFLKADDLQNTAYVSYYSHSHNLHRTSDHGLFRKIIQDLSLKEIREDFDKNVVDDTYFAFPYGRSADGVE